MLSRVMRGGGRQQVTADKQSREKNGPSVTSLLKALRDDHETLLELMTSTPCSSWQAKQGLSKAAGSCQFCCFCCSRRCSFFLFILYWTQDVCRTASARSSFSVSWRKRSLSQPRPTINRGWKKSLQQDLLLLRRVDD